MRDPVLTPLTPALASTLPAWFADPAELLLWGGPAWRFPLGAAQIARLFEGDSDGPQPTVDLWAVVEEGQLIASCRVGYDWPHGVARLAQVGIAPAFRRQGRAVPFLRAVLERIFAHVGIQKVELTAYPFNGPAVRTYQRLGFRPEGLRRSCVQVGEARWDAAIFGLLRAEWTATTTDPAAVAQRQLDAYNANDIDAFVACYSPDVECFDHPATLLARGTEALRARYVARFSEPNLYALLVNRIAVGNTVIDHERVTRTFPQGAGTIDVIAIYEVAGDVIRRVWFRMGEPVLDKS